MLLLEVWGKAIDRLTAAKKAFLHVTFSTFLYFNISKIAEMLTEKEPSFWCLNIK